MSRLVEAIQATGLPFEASPTGRWVKLTDPEGRVVYLQEYCWDENCVKHYVVYSDRAGGEGPLVQRFTDLEEAIRSGLRLSPAAAVN